MRVALVAPCRQGADGNPGWHMITRGIRNLVTYVDPDAQFLMVDMIEDNHVHWDAAMTCDVAIICGNPRFTLSRDSWWEGGIWHRLVQMKLAGKRVIDGWSGAAYVVGSGKSIPEIAAEIRALPRNAEYLHYAALVDGRITRDPIMQEIYAQEGIPSVQLPCSSWWAGDECVTIAVPRQRHAISVCPMHGQLGVADVLRAMQLQLGGPVDILASTWGDYLWARGAGFPALLINDHEVLLQQYREYDKVLAFRIHAAIPAAAAGCAVHVVAVDTRATACEAFELPVTPIHELVGAELVFKRATPPDTQLVANTLRRMLYGDDPGREG